MCLLLRHWALVLEYSAQRDREQERNGPCSEVKEYLTLPMRQLKFYAHLGLSEISSAESGDVTAPRTSANEAQRASLQRKHLCTHTEREYKLQWGYHHHSVPNILQPHAQEPLAFIPRYPRRDASHKASTSCIHVALTALMILICCSCPQPLCRHPWAGHSSPGVPTYTNIILNQQKTPIFLAFFYPRGHLCFTLCWKNGHLLERDWGCCWGSMGTSCHLAFFPLTSPLLQTPEQITAASVLTQHSAWGTSAVLGLLWLLPSCK